MDSKIPPDKENAQIDKWLVDTQEQIKSLKKMIQMIELKKTEPQKDKQNKSKNK